MSQCMVCRSFMEDGPWRLRGFKDILGPAPLLSSASRGCTTCKFLCDAVATTGMNLAGDIDWKGDDSSIHVTSEQNRFEVMIMWTTSAAPNIGRYVHLDILPQQGSITQDPLYGNISRTSAAAAATQWLSHCCQQHESCKPQPFSPTRLLRFWKSDIDEVPHVQFCWWTRQKRPSLKYACLSYCWGKDAALWKTTRNNATERQRDGIPWSQIPKLMQEAIELCLDLNVEYIWIDAFCIVQDNEIDWANECKDMGKIYAGSYFTIAAVSSDSPTQSLYKQPAINQVTYTSPLGERSIFTIRRSVDHAVTSMHTPNHMKRSCPLLTRAWCLQELVLSPRTLRFNQGELMWECNRELTCQCGRHGSEKGPKERFTRQYMDLLVGEPDPVIQSDEERHEEARRRASFLLSLWRAIVLDYSNLKLTFERDRLPALSAAAHTFSERLNQLVPIKDGGSLITYLAGIWSNDLSTLYWTVEDPYEHQQREPSEKPSIDYVTPTWSWIHARGTPLKTFGLHEGWLSQVQLLNSACTPATADPFGRVRPLAQITLHGRLIPATIEFLRPSANRQCRPLWVISTSLGHPRAIKLDNIHPLPLVQTMQMKTDTGRPNVFCFLLSIREGVPSKNTVDTRGLLLLRDTPAVTVERGSPSTSVNSYSYTSSSRCCPPTGDGVFVRIGVVKEDRVHLTRYSGDRRDTHMRVPREPDGTGGGGWSLFQGVRSGEVTIV